ncbi:hypothetical protein NJH24_17125 [Pseudomonas asiatica]|uniref:hypothetical protein n=1 Tax=Pseudomonas asiatica TaxID=2219225 RepID=UPI00209B188E|nr:hypothetical protein [Pseudomonas asiatica]MCO7536500.1 hypothetical protein [Pseudomonas asiatica]MCO7550248.1 hypothetical protein [Pseudomonas asiatica]MCO7560607.1 hypothetical protein [Pseudomonas asiatica]
MEGLIGLLCLGIAVGTWWWLSSRMKKSGRGWFIRTIAGSFAGCFMLFFLVGIAIEVGLIESTAPATSEMADVKKAETPEVAEVKAQKNVQADNVKSLHMTPAQFSERVNPLFEKFEKPYRVDPASITEGEVQDVLSVKLGPYASLIAGVSKQTGELLDVTMIGVGDGKPASGVEIMMLATAVLAAAAPDADHRDVFKGLPEMIDGSPKTYGQVKLSVKSTDMVGTWFMAAPI